MMASMDRSIMKPGRYLISCFGYFAGYATLVSLDSSFDVGSRLLWPAELAMAAVGRNGFVAPLFSLDSYVKHTFYGASHCSCFGAMQLHFATVLGSHPWWYQR